MEQPRGIGGWLTLYLVTLAVLRPAFSLVQLFRVLAMHSVALVSNPSFGTFRIGEAAVVVLDMAICWFIAWRMARVRNWSSVRIAVTGMWVIVVLGLCARAVLLVLLSGAPVREFTGLLLTGLGKAGGYALFWTAYLLRSNRVRATYPRRQSDKPLADVFT